MMKQIGIIVSIIMLPVAASAARFMHEPCDILRYNIPKAKAEEQKALTGCSLTKNGWVEVARCDGHQWSYLLQKDQSFMRCEGADALGGPTEKPCAPYEGNAEQFKQTDCNASGDTQ